MQPNNLLNIFLLFATQLYLLFQLVNEKLLWTVLNKTPKSRSMETETFNFTKVRMTLKQNTLNQYNHKAKATSDWAA